MKKQIKFHFLPICIILVFSYLFIREDKKNCTIEVRAGAGGEEASLFTQDIWNMYKNYCSRKDWRWSELSVSHTASGGYFVSFHYLIYSIKKGIVKIIGEGSYGILRTESGVHVIQNKCE